jgi:hypothetical protein
MTAEITKYAYDVLIITGPLAGLVMLARAFNWLTTSPGHRAAMAELEEQNGMPPLKVLNNFIVITAVLAYVIVRYVH